MNSRPVAVRPSYSGRRASLSQRDRTTCQALLLRARRALLCALSLYLSFIIASPAGENEPAEVNLFLDITSNEFVDRADLTQKRQLNLAGVPVVVGGNAQNGDAAPSIAAGIVGGYKFDLGNNMSLKPSGVISRTHIDGDGILSTGRVGGDVALQYQSGGKGLLLRPSLHATMQQDVLGVMDYALDAEVWQAIGWGVNLTAALGHSWRDSELFQNDDRESAYGRLGLKMDLSDSSNLELSYGFSTTEGPLASQFNVSQGPGMWTHWALAPGWQIDGGYTLSTVERGYDDNDADALRHDLTHRLHLASDWAISSTTGAEWHISAGYDYEQTLTDDPVTPPTNHRALVNFALNF
jgi:hypothetical protein